MNLRDQLPILGEEQNNGTIKIGRHIILDKDAAFGLRPDYKEFREKNLQSEFECAAVLVGIRGIEHCKQIVDKFGYKIAQEEGINYDELLNHPKGHVWCQFDKIMQDIRTMIKLGIASAELKVIKIEGYRHFKDFFFKSNIYYDPLQFMALAEKNSFPIHDELQFAEHKDGTLYWLADEIQDGPIKTAKTQGIDIREIVIEYLDNTEIKITVKKNDIRTLNAGALGFDLSKGRVAWNILIEILEQPPHKYDCGPCNSKREKTDYQKKYGYLRQISKKLVVNFFNKELELSLPIIYSLFESIKDEVGVFKPIFKVKDRSTLALCPSKSDFDFKFPRALKKAKKHPNDIKAQQYLIDLIGEAKGKGYINEHHVESLDKFATDAAFLIHKIRDDDHYDNQPDILSQDPDCVSVENIENYSDGTF